MKTLVFSDTHLELPVDERKFQFLQAIINDADRVIINGDFFEGYYIHFEEFLASGYKHLFPLLKKKKTVYIWGNHDAQNAIDARTALFADITTDRYELPVNGKTLIFEHGDSYTRIFPGPIPKKTPLPLPQRLITRSANLTEQIIVRKLGKNSMRSLFNRFNLRIKKKTRSLLKSHEIMVCGHTHLAEFSPAQQFINTGLIRYGLAQYLTIQGSHIQPVEHWYA